MKADRPILNAPEDYMVKTNVPVSAAGITAVTTATQMALKVMSPKKTFSLLSKLNQKKGIDCPGCAWPDPKKRSSLGEFCENGVKAIAEEAMDRYASPDFFEKYAVSDLLKQSDYWLGQQGRLTNPMMLEECGHYYFPITWERAFQEIAEELKALDDPDEAIFYTSGRSSNEAAFLYQLFVRMFGTNNLPDCSNMCHESSGYGLSKTLGIGKGSVTLEDFVHAEVILIFGQNPGTNHPRMLTTLENAKLNGAQVVVVNPLKEVGLLKFKNPQSVSGVLGSGTTIADLYLNIRINEDVALLKYVMKRLLLLEEQKGGVFDQGFIQGKTQDYDLLIEDLRQYDLMNLANRTGLPTEQLDQLVKILSKPTKIIACWAMGITQHVNAVDNVQEIVNLLLLKGSIGKKGAGTCPVRGHSNVQGDRSVGIWEYLPKGFEEKLPQVFGFQPPKKPGFHVVDSIKAMKEGKAKFFLALGGNFYSAAPDSEYTAEALKQTNMTVHIATKLNRSHLVHGKKAIILPCLGRTDKHIQNGKEQFVTVENSMGVVHPSFGQLNPIFSTLKSEPEIIARLAHAVVGSEKVDWIGLIDDYDQIRDLIAQVVKGFENYNQRVKDYAGFELPNGPRKGVFTNNAQKALFTQNKLSEITLQEGEFLMMTIRSHDQFNTTIYGLDDRYRGIRSGRNIVLVNRDDLEEQELEEFQEVDLVSHYGHERRMEQVQLIAYDIPKGCIATYFPEANVLIPINQVAAKSFTPASKSIKVKITPRF